jgi:hypothetical protein
MFNEPGPRGSPEFRWPPRGPGSGTIDHHLTALASADRVQEDQDREKEGALVSDLEAGYDCPMRQRIAVVGAAVFLSSCFGSFSADRRTLPARASFDLECPQEKLKFTDLGNESVGVAGCGKKGVYVSACDGQPGEMTTSCKWVQN